VKKASDGRVSKWLNEQIHQGAHVEVMPPMGNFTTALSSNNARHLLCIAGGSGITPILSIIKSALFVEQQSVVTLVYANMNEATTMFAAELDNMQKQYQHRLRVVHVREEDQQGTAFFVGRLSHDGFQNILSNYAPNLSSVDAFLCGPEGLMNIARTGLLEAGLPMQRIHQEYFSISSTLSTSSTSEAATTMSDSTTEIVTRRVKIRLYGQDHEFDVHPDETILSAAQRADLDPPYACQIGACCTCRAKLVSGSASMDEREALSDDEIADGYILTCQAHPTSDGCFADYDQ
jgi:ring-1,2-phenylacetyl-CoA epoxidase subunit PaaE